MNKDEEFNPYRPEAIDETKALKLTQKDQEFKDSIQGLKDNQEKLDGNYESLASELRGKSQEDIDNDQDGFEKLRKDYDKAGIAADENREALQQKEGEYEKFKEENRFGQEVGATSEVGKDNVNVGDDYKGTYHATPDDSGHDVSASSLNGLGDDAKREAVEAARPAVDSPPQRDNAFTQLEDSTPPQETTPAQEQEQTTTPDQEQAPEQTGQRDNAFTEIENSKPKQQSPGQAKEEPLLKSQAPPGIPREHQQRDNAFTQSGEATTTTAPVPQQEKER